MLIKYLIVDDEPIAHKLLAKFAADLGSMELQGNCYNAEQAQAALQDKSVDVIFLDINMPKVSGFEFLKGLQSPPQVIIVSAHREYALESYEYDTLDYLLKPFNPERFEKAVEKVRAKLQAQGRGKPDSADNYVFIKDEKKHHKVALADISYIKANGNYTSVYLQESSLLSQMKISDFEKLLPEEQFCRIHRSYIIAKDAITLLKASEVHLGETVLPVGRVYKEKVSELVGK